MSRWRCLLCVGILSVGVAACGDSKGGEAPPTEPPPTEPPPLLDEPSTPPPLIDASAAFGYADPFWSTVGMGFNYGGGTPAVQVPNGLVRLGPDTSNGGSYLPAVHTSGYNYGDKDTFGFSHLHFVGTGVEDYGNLRVLPFRDPATASASKPYTALDKASEYAEPGYYRVDLPEVGVRVELSANAWVGMHRYTMLEDGDLYLLWDASSSIQQNAMSSFGEVEATVLSDGARGVIEYGGPYTGRTHRWRMYYRLAFDVTDGGVPDMEVEAWPADVAQELSDDGELVVRGAPSGLVFRFPELKAGDELRFRVALSPTSVDNAAAHLAQSAARSFDDVRADARDQWEQKLGKILVSADDDEELRKFYSALYALWRMPTRWQDAGGAYVGFDNQRHEDPGHVYLTDLSLWDTYRTLHPLYDLIDPALAHASLNSLLLMAEQGGGIPRWPAATGYTGGMIGASATHLFANAALRDMEGVDYEAAFEYLAKAGRVWDPTLPGAVQRPGIENYRSRGYVTDEEGHSVARTLEYYWNDHSLAALAEVLGRSDDAEDFRAQSRRWTELWNDELRFFRPRLADGSWNPSPRDTDVNMSSGAFTEGSAWHYRFFLPFDWDGLIARWDDPEDTRAQIDVFFDSSKSLEGNPPFGGLLPDPYYWHSNEPDIDAAMMYFHLDAPEVAAQRVRQIQRVLYRAGPEGVPGNDDGGTLSAWYVFQAIGLYPQVGSDRYYAVAPLFRHIRVELGDGKEALTILSEATRNIARHAGEVELNRTPIDRKALRYEQLPGATLWFNLVELPPETDAPEP